MKWWCRLDFSSKTDFCPTRSAKIVCITSASHFLRVPAQTVCQCGCSVEEVPSFEAKAERLEPLLAILLSGLVYLQTFSITCWHSRKIPDRPSFIIQGDYNINPKCGAKREPWRVAQGFFNVRSPLEVEQVAPVLCLGLNGKKSPEPELLVRKCCTCLVKGKLTGRCFSVLTGHEVIEPEWLMQETLLDFRHTGEWRYTRILVNHSDQLMESFCK